MYCISCHTLQDLLFYHIDHLDFDGEVFIFRYFDIFQGILYLTFQRASDLSFVRFECTSEDRILYDLNEVV